MRELVKLVGHVVSPWELGYKSIEDMAGNNEIEQLLDGREDSYRVSVVMKEHMDADVFGPLLRTSQSSWKQMELKAAWIKLSPENSHLENIVKEEGFSSHHSEGSYKIFSCWLPGTLNPIRANPSHMVGVCAVVLNEQREVLVVQEKSGRFQGTGVWKLPTVVVNEGENIWHAAVREVREKTGVETEFVKVLCFRQSHKSYYTKSDLLFLCKLQPNSTIIKIQKAEIQAAQWMPIGKYAEQPCVVQDEQFNFMEKICLARADNGYAGFACLAIATWRGRRTCIYCNNPGV